MKSPFYQKPRDSAPSKDQLVMGLHTVAELLRVDPKRILKVYTSVKFAQDRKSNLLKECEKHHIPIVETSEAHLTKLCESDSHQSFVAQVKSRQLLNIKEFLEKTAKQERILVLMCDQIFDPQNFGALIRCAECFGADGVVWSKNRGSDLSPVSAKASCGATEWISLVRISNLAEGVSQFQKAGFEVLAAAFSEESKNAFTFPFSPKTVLIVGSEGEGIQPLILKRANHILHIPMSGHIQSLNVAQAASSLLTSYRIQIPAIKP